MGLKNAMHDENAVKMIVVEGCDCGRENISSMIDILVYQKQN
jgi:hypothetical protein